MAGTASGLPCGQPEPRRAGVRLVLHLVNLSHPGAWRPPLHELIPVGPFEVAVQLPEGVTGEHARCLVADCDVPLVVADGWARFEIARIVDHEVVVIETVVTGIY